MESPAESPVIELRDVGKTFSRPQPQHGRFAGLRTLLTRKTETTVAVDGISLDVARGEVVGYLGPNGAGKSTTIKMMTGILVPTSGEVRVNGVVPWRERERNARQIGVVFGQRTQLWWDLPLRDSLDLVATMYRMAPADYRRELARFTDLLQLGDFLGRPVRQLSLGQRMRGDLAAAMIYRPAVLYLDEPTIGLDVVAKEVMREFIADVNREHGTTVVLTTHDLADVERLCPRVVLIDHGRVLYDGDVEALKSRYAPHRGLVVRLAEGEPPLVDADLAGLGAELAPDALGVRDEPGAQLVRFPTGRVAASDLIAGLAQRRRLADVSLREPDLEGVVRELYRGHGEQVAATPLAAGDA
ncbi:ABC transporter ATP-binding protein [Cellulomonas sp. S1-8]|uniref:ABC transporter ATP-binding protein n=1 Tax=Cellulomonas sp. S1-8 TaxID=2904790 RepID=UPI0022445269|nr:ATP-binding cassette domain-containing protein [Cellulomonas sp. S1-8]UZN03269.1 ATP-binding cassette domain-containing protein [Cellulomonas sp. S1-8]